MLPRKTLVLAAALLLALSHICQAQNDFEMGLEKFFQSRKLIETLSIRNDVPNLCRHCIAKIDEIAPQLLDGVSKDKLIRIEGHGSQNGDIESAMRVAKLVHDYLRERYQLNSLLYLTGYSGTDTSADDYRVDIVSYDKILPVEDAKIETVIIR